MLWLWVRKIQSFYFTEYFAEKDKTFWLNALESVGRAKFFWFQVVLKGAMGIKVFVNSNNTFLLFAYFWSVKYTVEKCVKYLLQFSFTGVNTWQSKCGSMPPCWYQENRKFIKCLP